MKLAEEFCRLAEMDFAQTKPRFSVFHVPHAGDECPEELFLSIRVPETEFRAIHERMRDTEADRLVPLTYLTDYSIRSFPRSHRPPRG